MYIYIDRSICIQIHGTNGKLEKKHFQLNIKCLPGEIKSGACTLKVVSYLSIQRIVYWGFYFM